MPSVLQRFARVAPYFRSGKAAIVAAGLAALVGAATEPLIPALMQHYTMLQRILSATLLS